MEKPDLITPLRATAIAAALLLAAPLAHAQMESVMAMDESSGFYFGGGLGQASPDDADKATAWKLYGGWQLNKWLAAELGYVDFGSSDYDSTRNGVPYSDDFDTWGVSAMAVASFPIPIGALDRFSVLGKLGTMYYDRDDNSSFNEFDDDGWTVAWGLGVQYTFSERLGLRAEWENYNDLDTDMWSVSLNYKF